MLQSTPAASLPECGGFFYARYACDGSRARALSCAVILVIAGRCDHLFRPPQAFRSIGFARGLRSLFAGVLRPHFRAHHPITEDPLSGFSAHRRISALFARTIRVVSQFEI
jgi:hypothetical protein